MRGGGVYDAVGLEHDPEKCVAVFRKDHAQCCGPFLSTIWVIRNLPGALSVAPVVRTRMALTKKLMEENNMTMEEVLRNFFDKE
jgi:hypothetical protein